MLLKEIMFLEDDIVGRFKELESKAAKYVPYMFIDARSAEGADVGQHLPAIIAGPAIDGQERVSKGDYVARVIQTGTYNFPDPIKHLFVLTQATFDLFTPLSGRDADMEGFLPYETEGEEFDVVQDGPYFLLKKGDQVSKIPASIFSKQFRPSGE